MRSLAIETVAVCELEDWVRRGGECLSRRVDGVWVALVEPVCVKLVRLSAPSNRA